MEEQELSPLDRINQEFGLPVSSISKGPEPLSPPASAPAMPAAAPTPSALDSINRQFGISFETPTEKPAVAPTVAGPTPGTEVAPQAPGRIPPAIAPPPRSFTGGGSGWEREPTTTERVVETLAPPKPTAEMGTAERLSRHFAGGVLGTAEGLGGALQWVTGGTLGKDFSNYMADLRKQVTPEGEASFIDQLASGAGSMATFFIPGFGAARGASLVGRFAPKAAQWLGAGTMAVTEAATEAGQVYRDELEKGKGEGKAGTAASWTFWLNLPVLTLTDKLAFFGNEGKALSRALRGMVTEGSQESLQEVISTWSQEEQQNLKNILTSGAVGAILGGGVGAIAKPMGVRQGEPQPQPGVETAPPEAPVGGEFNRTGMDTLMGQQEIAPVGPPVLPPGARPGVAPEPGAEAAPAATVAPELAPLPPTPPEAEVPPEVAAVPPSPVISPPVPGVAGFEVTKTRKGWSVAGMDFTNQADAEAFAAKAAAADTGVTPPVVRPDSPMGVTQDNVAPEPTKAKTVPTEPKTVPEVEKTVPKTPDQPLDTSGTATQAAATETKAPEAPFKMPSAEVLAGMSDADLEALAEQVKAAGVDVEMLGTGAYTVEEPGPGDPFLERLKALRQAALAKVPGAVVAPTGALSATPETPFTEYIKTGVPGARAVAPAPEAPALPPDAWKLPRDEYIQEGLKGVPAKEKAALTRSLMAEHERSVEEAMQKQEPNLSWEQIGDYPELAQKYIPETPADDVWPYGEAPNIPASWRSETPVQTRDKKITEHEQIVGQTKVNAITYSKFIDMVKTQNWPEVQNELHLSSANFTRDAFDHNFNPLNLMARLVEGGVPRAEAKILVKDYEAQAFKPVREALGAKKAPEPKVLSPEMEAVAAFNKKFGGAGRVGIPEAPSVDYTGLAPGIDPVATVFAPSTGLADSLPTYKKFPLDRLELLPSEFQHKRGANPLTGGDLNLMDTKTWVEKDAGHLSIYETADGRFIVANGHQRYGLATRPGVTDAEGNSVTHVPIQVYREVDGWTPSKVREAAAYENIRGGTVDALDIASIIRETGLGPEQLKKAGVSLSKAETKQGLGLAGLIPRIWADVYEGKWGHGGDLEAVQKGAYLGEVLRGNAPAQEAIYQRYMELQSEGKPPSLATFRNAVDSGRLAVITDTQQMSLLGPEDVKKARIFERGDIITYLKTELGTDKNALIAANRNRERLEAAGNKITPEENKRLAAEAREILNGFGKFKDVGGSETDNILNEYAEKLAQARSQGEENAVKQEALAAIHSALQEDSKNFGVGGKNLGPTIGPGSPGGGPEQYGGETRGGPGSQTYSVREDGTLGLYNNERPLSKFEKRLNGIISQYPNADPERVAQALRATPKSTDRELAGLAAMKPGEASGVVQGTLTAMQRAELAKRSGMPGAALFPEMGMGGGGLFDQAPEARQELPPAITGKPVERWQGNLLEWSAPIRSGGLKDPAARARNWKDFKGTVKTGEIDDTLPLTDKALSNWKENKEELGFVNMKGLAEEDVRSILSAVRRGEASVTVNRMGKMAFYKLKGEAASIEKPAKPKVPQALEVESGEWGMVAHPGGQAEAKEMAQRMGGQDPKNEYRARVDEIGQWIIEKKVVTPTAPDEFAHLKTSPDETTGKVGDRTLKQEALFEEQAEYDASARMREQEQGEIDALLKAGDFAGVSEKMQRIIDEKKAWADENVRLAGEKSSGVKLQSTLNPDKQILIHRSTDPKYRGKWQITQLDKWEYATNKDQEGRSPSGHQIAPTLEAAIRLASDEYDSGQRNTYRVIGASKTVDGVLFEPQAEYDAQRAPAPAFYSKMREHIDAKLPGKGSSENMVSLIEGWAGMKEGVRSVVGTNKKGEPIYANAEFKRDELLNSGLIPWIKEQKGTVTKQQVLEYLDTAGRVVLKDVDKGERSPETKRHIEKLKKDMAFARADAAKTYDTLLRELRDNPINWDADSTTARYPGIADPIVLAQGLLKNDPDYTRIAQKALMGDHTDSTRVFRASNIINAAVDSDRKVQALSFAIDQTEAEARPTTKYARYQLPGAIKDTYFEKVITLEPKDSFDSLQPTYKSPHWDELNPVAHIRGALYKDVNGDLVMVVNGDWQADWVSAGRHEGWRLGPKEMKEVQRRRDLLTDEHQVIEDRKQKLISNAPLTLPPEIIKEFNDLNLRSQEIEKEAIALNNQMKGVPQHPFPNTWQEFVMKKLLRMVAEQNVERAQRGEPPIRKLAWTTGEQQFERWGTDRVDWKKVEGGQEPDLEGGFIISATEQHRGNAGGVDIEAVARERGHLLENVGIGVTSKEELTLLLKETLNRERSPGEVEKLADRIWARMQQEPEGTSMPRKEFFELIYDKAPKKFLNPYAKQWGAEVGKAAIEGGFSGQEYTHPSGAMPNIKEIKDAIGDQRLAIQIRQQATRIYEALTDENGNIRQGTFGPAYENEFKKVMSHYGSKKLAHYFGGDLISSTGFQTVHSIDITPAMQDSVLYRGQALFEEQAPYKATPEERQGWVAPGEPVPSFKEFEADLAKDDYARERELRDPANKLIPLYEGERYLGTRGGDFIKDAKGKTVKLTNEDIYERLYNPKTATLPIGTETAKPEDLLGTPEKPGPEGTVEKPPGYAGSLVRSVREKFSAANISEKSRLAHQFIVEHLGWAAREVKKDAAILDKYSDRFGAMTREDLIKFTDAAETGNLDQVAPDLQEAAGAWRRISDGLHSLLVNAKGGESAYWENYFPRLFENPEQAAIAIAAMLKSRGTSLTGPESFNKVRTQLLFSDSIKPVEEGGLGLTPRYPNYVDMMKANIYEKMRFLTGKYIEADLKEAGFITKAKTPGWEALTGDKTLEGYYAHPDVARVMENFLSKGLRGDPLFELYNSPVSFVNTVLVGMSAFHATFSTFSDLAHGIGSNLTRAIGAAVTGRFGLSGHYLAEMAKAANIPANVIRGGKLGEEYTAPGSHPEMSAIVDLMTKAGIRFESPGLKETLKAIFKPGGVSQTEMGQMSKSFAEVAAQQMGVPRKIMETIAWPIMSYLVPRLKINATARLLQMELDTLARDGKLKEMTPQDLTQLAQEVARKSDNIFGQMVYDNLSMKRGMRDGLRILVGFPGWNIGSFTDILQTGKGIYQAGRSTVGALKGIAAGRKPTWETMSRSNRMSMEFYLGTALIMAVFGAITQRLLAGDWPEDYKDLFMPRTGELMSNGQPERLRAPTYMRDVLSLNHPVEMAKHKLNFPLRMFSALVDNQDFFGTQIRDPYAGAATQAGQVGKYVGKSLLPFGIQGYLATESPKARALNLIGITKVPRLYSNSDAMNVIDEYNKQNRAAMTSREAEETKNLKSELRKLAKAQDEDGFKEAAQAAMTEGKLTRQQIKTIVAESQAPPGLGRFVALPVEWQVRAWKEATDAEKEAWRPYFIKKVMSAKPEILIRNRDILDPTLREMGYDDAADAIQNLKISDKAGTFKLAGLGIRQPTGEMGDIDTVDLAMAREIAAQEAKLGTEKKARAKKNKYSFLGIQ